MLIDCPSCTRSYTVSTADLGRGRTVVCPRCETRWFQPADGGEPLEAAAVSARLTPVLDELPAPPRRAPLPRPVGVAVCLALAILAAASLVVRREAVVRTLPRAAALYALAGMPVNVVGLAFARVTPERLASSDVTIRGSLRNVAGHRIAVPRLAFEVRDAAGATLVRWSEAVPARTLPANGAVDFTSLPHRLPADSRTVLVRFD